MTDVASSLEPPIVYLDTSALGRLSDPDPRLLPQAAQVDRIVAACVIGRLRLLISEILVIEGGRARSEAVRATYDGVLAVAWAGVPLAPTRELAMRLVGLGLRTADALHIAAAYTGGATYAVSCDVHWLRRAARMVALLGPRPAIVIPEECARREGL